MQYKSVNTKWGCFYLAMVTAICEISLGSSFLLVKYSTTRRCEICHTCFDSVQGWMHICLHLYVRGFCYVAFRTSSAQHRDCSRSAFTRGVWQVYLIIVRAFWNAFRRQITGPGYCHLRLIAAVFHYWTWLTSLAAYSSCFPFAVQKPYTTCMTRGFIICKC
jgi:hypothetical protein